MRVLVAGLLCITAIQGKPLSRNDVNAGFMQPGETIPGDLLEARDLIGLNGIDSNGGNGMGKTKREAAAAGNPMNKMPQPFQGSSMTSGFPGMGNMPSLRLSIEEKTDDAAAALSSGRLRRSGNTMGQLPNLVMQPLQGLGGAMTFVQKTMNGGGGSGGNNNQEEEELPLPF